MTEASISGQYNAALFTIFCPPAMLKLVTEEFIAEKVFKYLISFDYNCKICNTVQSLWI